MEQNTFSTVTIAFKGEIVVNRETLVALLRDALADSAKTNGEPQKQPGALPHDGKLPRLAYSIDETAEILGISYATVHRLLTRGLLRSSLACRHKMIAKTEIERFLKETSQSLWHP
jgi:excisionase family DNA binding protein